VAWPDDAVFVGVDGDLHAVAQAESGETGHPLGFVNPAIYAIAQGPAYHQAFHDMATGDNSVFWAHPAAAV
jgi:hypothetical protein